MTPGTPTFLDGFLGLEFWVTSMFEFIFSHARFTRMFWAGEFSVFDDPRNFPIFDVSKTEFLIWALTLVKSSSFAINCAFLICDSVLVQPKFWWIKTMVSCWFARKLGGPGAADWWKLSLGVTWQDFLRMGISWNFTNTIWVEMEKQWMSWCNLQTFADSTCSTHTMRKYEAANAVVFMETMRFWPAGMIIPQGKPTKVMTYRMILVRSGRGLVAVPEWILSLGISHPFPVKTCLWGMVSLPRALGWVSSLRSPLWIGEWPNASENC